MVLVQGVRESLRAAARLNNTAGRSFTKLKTHLDREEKSSRALHKTKLAPKPPARNRLSLTPRSKAPASKALGGAAPVDGDVATVAAAASSWDWHAAQAAFAAAEVGDSQALLAGQAEPAPAAWGATPVPRTGYRRATEFASPLTRGLGPSASGAAGSRLATGVPFTGRLDVELRGPLCARGPPRGRRRRRGTRSPTRGGDASGGGGRRVGDAGWRGEGAAPLPGSGPLRERTRSAAPGTRAPREAGLARPSGRWRAREGAAGDGRPGATRRVQRVARGTVSPPRL